MLMGNLAFSLVELDYSMVFASSCNFTTHVEACVMLHFVAIIMQTLVSIQLDG